MAKRVIATRAGGPDVLRLETFDPAAPGHGEVLLRNQACGVAFADVLFREGLYPGHKPPIVPGYEVVGQCAHGHAEVLCPNKHRDRRGEQHFLTVFGFSFHGKKRALADSFSPRFLPTPLTVVSLGPRLAGIPSSGKERMERLKRA